MIVARRRMMTTEVQRENERKKRSKVTREHAAV